MNPITYDGDGDGAAERGTHQVCSECNAMVELTSHKGHKKDCSLFKPATDKILSLTEEFKDTYTSRKGLTYEKLGESPAEWCPAEIKGYLPGRMGRDEPVYHIGSIKVEKVPYTCVVDGVTHQGFGQSITYVDDQKDHKKVTTPFTSAGIHARCELCGHGIMEEHILINYGKKEWMIVGSECIGHHYGKVIRQKIKVFKDNETRAEFKKLLPLFMDYLNDQLESGEYAKRMHRLEYWAWKLRSKYQQIEPEKTTSRVLSSRVKEMKKFLEPKQEVTR